MFATVSKPISSGALPLSLGVAADDAAQDEPPTALAALLPPASEVEVKRPLTTALVGFAPFLEDACATAGGIPIEAAWGSHADSAPRAASCC